MFISRGKNDFYTSLERSLEEIDPKWRKYPGLIICGSHDLSGAEEKIEQIENARINSLPCLGICLGMQLMAVEYARNIIGLANADTQESDINTKEPIIIKMNKLRVGIKMVGGSYENHWHNYKFNNDYLATFKDWKFTIEDGIVEEMWLRDAPWHMGIQYHPEYGSSAKNQHQVLKWFISTCKENR
uniref:CTP synthase (glutamine hydrolyzing) n=1 Tax=viral metagenome TaxID=1070528 RepID=A0A6H1ZDS1_9ZZZZ